jgi:hypothetical protein
MMLKKLCVVVVAMMVLGHERSGAQTEMTFLLRSGEKVVGVLASWDHTTVDVRRGGGRREPAVPDLVLIDFAGDPGKVPSAEIERAREPGHLVAMRDGRLLRGTLVDFLEEGGPNQRVVFDVEGAGRQEFRLDEARRLHLAEFTPQALVAVGGRVETITVSLPGNAGWMPTGFRVTRGERFRVDATGGVVLQANEKPTGPAGVPTGLGGMAKSAGLPLPGQPFGSLIGRVERTGAIFALGLGATVTAAAEGEVFLGLNETNVTDNSGEFSVTLARQAGTAPGGFRGRGGRGQ